MNQDRWPSNKPQIFNNTNTHAHKIHKRIAKRKNLGQWIIAYFTQLLF